MPFILATVVVLIFAGIIWALGLPGHAGEVGDKSRQSLSLLRDPSLTDSSKERELQRKAIELFRLFGILVAGSLVAIGTPLLLVWVMELLGVSSLDSVLDVLARPDFLAGTVVLGTAAYLALRHYGPP